MEVTTCNPYEGYQSSGSETINSINMAKLTTLILRFKKYFSCQAFGLPWFAVGFFLTPFMTANAQKPLCTFYITDSIINVKCFGDCSGGWISYAHSGTAPYNWGAGPTNATSDTVKNMCAGSYTITAVDAHGCTASASVTIVQPSTPLNSKFILITHPCNTCTNGSITDSAYGGTSGYTFLWNPGGQTNATASDLSAGTYQCCVTDASGCMRCDSINLDLESVKYIRNAETYIDISPNPNTGRFNLQLSGLTDQCELTMYNTIGQSVYNETLHNSSSTLNKIIDMSGHGKGIFIFTIKTLTNVALKKVVVY